MAKYFHVDETIEPLLTVSDITDDTVVAIKLSGDQVGAISVSQERKRRINWVQTTLPSPGVSTLGLWSVQTGANKGLYVNNGNEMALISAYSLDGTWPITFADPGVANYFGVAESVEPLLDGDDIVNVNRVAVKISGTSVGQMPLSDATKYGINWVQTTLPAAASSPRGYWSVQTGGSRGFYVNNGTSHYALVAYSGDGIWPIT